MTAGTLATIMEIGGIFALGLYLTLWGHRIIGKKPGQDLRYDLLMEKRSGTLRWTGIGISLCAIGMAFIKWLQAMGTH